MAGVNKARLHRDTVTVKLVQIMKGEKKEWENYPLNTQFEKCQNDRVSNVTSDVLFPVLGVTPHKVTHYKCNKITHYIFQ